MKDKVPGPDGMHLKFFSRDIFPISSHMHIFSLDRNINSLQLLLMLLVTKFVIFILIDKLDEGR